jgi:hypothetical protein
MPCLDEKGSIHLAVALHLIDCDDDIALVDLSVSRCTRIHTLDAHYAVGMPAKG